MIGFEFDNFRVASWTERGILRKMLHSEFKQSEASEQNGAMRKIKFLLSTAALCTAATFSSISVAKEMGTNIPPLTPREVLIGLRHGPALPDQVEHGYWNRLGAALKAVDRLPDSDGSDDFPSFF